MFSASSSLRLRINSRKRLPSMQRASRDFYVGAVVSCCPDYCLTDPEYSKTGNPLSRGPIQLVLGPITPSQRLDAQRSNSNENPPCGERHACGNSRGYSGTNSRSESTLFSPTLFCL